ncbi:unnamed protein product, partial [Allacma fusca]
MQLIIYIVCAYFLVSETSTSEGKLSNDFHFQDFRLWYQAFGNCFNVIFSPNFDIANLNETTTPILYYKNSTINETSRYREFYPILFNQLPGNAKQSCKALLFMQSFNSNTSRNNCSVFVDSAYFLIPGMTSVPYLTIGTAENGYEKCYWALINFKGRQLDRIDLNWLNFMLLQGNTLSSKAQQFPMSAIDTAKISYWFVLCVHCLGIDANEYDVDLNRTDIRSEMDSKFGEIQPHYSYIMLSTDSDPAGYLMNLNTVSNGKDKLTRFLGNFDSLIFEIVSKRLSNTSLSTILNVGMRLRIRRSSFIIVNFHPNQNNIYFHGF